MGRNAKKGREVVIGGLDECEVFEREKVVLWKIFKKVNWYKKIMKNITT